MTVPETVTVTTRERRPPAEPRTDPQREPEEGDGRPPGQRANECGRVGPNVVEVVRGKVDCGEARSVYSGHDEAGPRVQHVGAWTCEGGNAQTGLVLTCSEGRREFVVRRMTG